MIDKNNIPVGYKNSPVGIIPQEWEVKRLGEIAKYFSGGTPNSMVKEMYGGKIPFIRSGEIHNSRTTLSLTEEGLSKSSAKMVNVGDLIYALYGANSGDCAISQINGAINQAILCIRSEKVINPYLYPFLELQKGRFISMYLQGGQGNLSADIVARYIIPIPPLAEQKKIAEILCTWDDAIEKQSKLIEKLELRKRALINSFFNGKIRINGYQSDWRLKNIGSSYRVQGGYAFKSGLFVDNGVPIIRISNLPINHHFVDLKNCVYYQDINEISPQFYVTKGMLLIAMSGATVGKTAIYNDEGIGFLNQRVGMFTGKSDDIRYDYLVYLFQSATYFNQLNSILSTSAQPNISSADIEDMKFMIPSPIEQKAIASVLSAADKEIETHRKKLEALRQQKRGLMQQLLTGKTRVKI